MQIYSLALGLTLLMNLILSLMISVDCHSEDEKRNLQFRLTKNLPGQKDYFGISQGDSSSRRAPFRMTVVIKFIADIFPGTGINTQNDS